MKKRLFFLSLLSAIFTIGGVTLFPNIADARCSDTGGPGSSPNVVSIDLISFINDAQNGIKVISNTIAGYTCENGALVGEADIKSYVDVNNNRAQDSGEPYSSTHSYGRNGGSPITDTNSLNISSLSNGTYNLVTRAESLFGSPNYDQMSKSFTINRPSVPATCSISSSPEIMENMVLVENDISFSASGGSGNYTWNFGDGGSGSGSPSIHRYSKSLIGQPMTIILKSNGSDCAEKTITLFSHKLNLEARLRPLCESSVDESAMPVSDAANVIFNTFRPGGNIYDFSPSGSYDTTANDNIASLDAWRRQVDDNDMNDPSPDSSKADNDYYSAKITSYPNDKYALCSSVPGSVNQNGSAHINFDAMNFTTKPAQTKSLVAYFTPPKLNLIAKIDKNGNGNCNDSADTPVAPAIFYAANPNNIIMGGEDGLPDTYGKQGYDVTKFGNYTFPSYYVPAAKISDTSYTLISTPPATVNFGSADKTFTACFAPSAPKTFTVSVNPTSRTVQKITGQLALSSNYTVTVAPQNGFTGSVNLSQSGAELPTDASVSIQWSSISVNITDTNPKTTTFKIGATDTAISKTYNFTVKGTSSGYPDASASASVTVTDASTPPSPPQNLQGSAICSYAPSPKDAIKLSWNPSSGATKYRIYRDGNFIKEVANKTNYDDRNVNVGVTYSYYVTAKNSSGESGPSNTISVLTENKCPAAAEIRFNADYGDYDVNGKWITASNLGNEADQVEFSLDPIPSGMSNPLKLSTNGIIGNISPSTYAISNIQSPLKSVLKFVEHEILKNGNSQGVISGNSAEVKEGEILYFTMHFKKTIPISAIIVGVIVNDWQAPNGTRNMNQEEWDALKIKLTSINFPTPKEYKVSDFGFSPITLGVDFVPGDYALSVSSEPNNLIVASIDPSSNELGEGEQIVFTINFVVNYGPAVVDIKANRAGGQPSDGPITIKYLVSSPFGARATLAWTSENAQSCISLSDSVPPVEIINGWENNNPLGQLNGTKDIYLKDINGGNGTVYNLGIKCQPQDSQDFVKIMAQSYVPDECSLTASPSSVFYGQSSLLSWKCNIPAGKKCAITPSIGVAIDPKGGSARTAKLTESATYTMKCVDTITKKEIITSTTVNVGFLPLLREIIPR